MIILDNYLHLKRFDGNVTACQPWPGEICWGKQGRSREAVPVFFVQLHLEFLSDAHIVYIGSGQNCLCILILALKNLSEGNTGDQKRLCMFSLTRYV